MSKTACVLGAGVGGLSAAIYARLAGFDVIVLEKSATPGGKAAGITIEGYELDPGPSIIIMVDIYRNLFRDAGRKMENYLNFDRLDILSRVVFGDQEPRDIPSDEKAALAMLRDISKADALALGKLLDDIAKVEPLLWKSVYSHPFTKPAQLLDLNLAKFAMALKPFSTFKQAVDKLFESDFLKSFFYGFPSYGGQSYNSKAPGAFLIPYYMFRTGVFFPRGGVRAIPEALCRLATELGVEFQLNTELKCLNINENRVVSANTSNGTIEADVWLSNIDPNTLAKLMGKATEAKPSYSYFTLHMGLKRKFDLQHHNLFVPSTFKTGFDELYGGKFPTEPIVYVNDTGRLDPKGAPEGKTNLFSVVTCPSKVSTCQWDEINGYEAAVVETLRKGGIEWDESDVEFKRIQTPNYFEGQHGNYLGSLYGVDESQRLWGSFPTANKDPKISNLAYAGGAVQPGAGLPMVILSGKFAVDELLHAK